jgi:hypothetical protein
VLPLHPEWAPDGESLDGEALFECLAKALSGGIASAPLPRKAFGGFFLGLFYNLQSTGSTQLPTHFAVLLLGLVAVALLRFLQNAEPEKSANCTEPQSWTRSKNASPSAASSSPEGKANQRHKQPSFCADGLACFLVASAKADPSIAKRDLRGELPDIHALRHTFATSMARAGVPLSHAQAALGHSDPKLTAQVYTHLQAEDLRGSLAAMAELPRAGEPMQGAQAPHAADQRAG